MLNAQLIMLASIFFFSLAGYFSSLLADQLLAFAMLIRFALPTFFGLISTRNMTLALKAQPSMIFLCVLRGAVIFLSQFLLYLTINKIGLASGIILYNLGPILLIILFTFLGNKLRSQDLLLIVFSFLGGLVFFKFDLKVDDSGLILGLGAAVFYAISQYLTANIAKQDADPKMIIVLVNFSATIISALYLILVAKPETNLARLELSSYIIILAMGLATYFNHYLRIRAFKLVNNPNTIVYLTYFAIPFSLLFMIIEGKYIETHHLMGSLIVLAGGFGQIYLPIIAENISLLAVSLKLKTRLFKIYDLRSCDVRSIGWVRAPKRYIYLRKK